MIIDRMVYRSTLQLLKDYYPFAFQSIQNRRVLDWLLFGERDLDASEYIVISHEKLFELNNIKKLKSSRNFRSGHFIKNYLENLGVQFKMKEYSYMAGKARAIKIFWPEAICNALKAERERNLNKETQISFLSEKPVSKRKLRQDMHNIKKHTIIDQNRINAPIMKYLSNINPQIYYRYLPNIDAARKYLLSQKFRNGMIESQLDVLNTLEHYPKPFYKQVETTDRIYTYGLSIQNLNKDLRRILLDDCLMADLKSCHLAIVAYDWNLPSLKNFLESGESFWTMILHDLGLPNTPQEKSGLKNALYAMVYGAKNAKIKSQLHGINWAKSKDKKAVKILKKDKEEFLQHPYIKMILNRRSEILEQIESQKGLEIFGQFYSIDSYISAKSLLARKSQAIETYVIGGAYEYAQDNPDRIRIISHEHDGFSAQLIKPSQKNLAEVKRGMNDRVEKRAADMGVKLSLEYQDPIKLTG